MPYFLTFLQPLSLSSVDLIFLLGEKGWFLLYSFSFLIASDFFLNCLAAVARYTACGVVDTGTGCVLIAILALPFVVLWFSLLVMDIICSVEPCTKPI